MHADHLPRTDSLGKAIATAPNEWPGMQKSLTNDHVFFFSPDNTKFLEWKKKKPFFIFLFFCVWKKSGIPNLHI